MTLIRFLYVAGLLLTTGTAVMTTFVVPRALAGVTDPGYAARIMARTRGWVGASSLMLLVATVATHLARPEWLAPRWVELTTVGLAVLTGTAGAVMLGRPHGPLAHQAIRLVLASTLVTIALPALPSRFTGLTLQSVLDPIASRAHILGGSVWVGGLVLSALLLSRSRAASRPDDLAFWPRYWTTFSGFATVSLGVVVATGSWLVWTRVGSLSHLLTTPYGVAVTIKVLIVAVMAALGGLHQLRLIPGVARARASGDESSVLRIATRDFRGTVVFEAVLGLGVIAVVPFLTGSAREQAASDAGHAYRPAVLDIQVALLGLAGAAVMVLLLWGATRVTSSRSQA